MQLADIYKEIEKSSVLKYLLLKENHAFCKIEIMSRIGEESTISTTSTEFEPTNHGASGYIAVKVKVTMSSSALLLCRFNC